MSRYRVKITNPWYNDKNDHFIIKVSTTLIPFYRTVKEVRYYSSFRPEMEMMVFGGYETAEKFVKNVIPDIASYKGLLKSLKDEYDCSLKDYKGRFKKYCNKRIV